jgi:hypothetical protein
MAVPADPGPNGIGVYFETEGISYCAYPAAHTALNAYVLAPNPTRAAGISGWEASVLINPTSWPAGITFDIGAGALNALTAPCFRVGYAVPRTGNPITLLTISTFYLTGPIVFGLGPCVPSSFDGLSAG